jgi:predicted permease
MRAAVKSLIRAPGFSLSVIVTLALALAASTTLFSAVDTLLLRAAPFHQPERLIAVFETPPGSTSRAPVSIPNFLALKQARSLADVAAFRTWGFVLTGAGDAERIAGARVTASLLPLLGVRPMIGRAFTVEEDVYGGRPLAILSYARWQRLGAPSALDQRPVVLNGIAHEVIGVLSPDARLPGPAEPEVLVPYGIEPFALTQRGNRALTVIARLGSGASLDQARADLLDISREVNEPSGGRWTFGATPLTEQLTARFRPTLLLLGGAVAILLLIACANVAGLSIVRMNARRGELAVYRALGASPGWIARRLFLESVLLASVAGAIGLGLSSLFLQLLIVVAPPDLSRLVEAEINLRVALFAFGLSIVSGSLAGLAPAIRGRRADLSGALRAHGPAGRADALLRQGALAAQVALSAVVLLGAGLLFRSFERASAVDLGFDPSRSLTMTIAPDHKYADAARRLAFFDEVIAKTGSLRGVESAGIVSHVPLAGAPLTADIVAHGRRGDPSSPLVANYSAAGGDWFRAAGIPIQRGRAFTATDGPGAQPVVVLNESLARALWPGADPLGRQVVVGATLGADPSPRMVIGIAGDVRASIEAPVPLQVYIPHAQNPWPTMTLVVRATGDPAALAPEIRGILRSIDPAQAAYNVRPFRDIVSRALASRRFQLWIVSLFALAAAALSAFGVYAAVAFTVTLRTGEIGVRLALGARPSSVMILAARDSVLASVAGLAAGVVVSAAGAQAMSSLLFGVSPLDPATFAGTAAGLAALTVSVSVLSARRAAWVDPIVTLRGM